MAAAAITALIASPATPFSRLRSNRCSFFKMSDAGSDCGTAFHPSPEQPWRSASSSFVHMHSCIALVIVAAIAYVHVHLADPIPDHAFELPHLRP